MQLSGQQLFVAAITAMVGLGIAAYLDHTYLPVFVSALLGVLFLFTNNHGSASGAANVLQGINTGVPLQTSLPNPTTVPGEKVG